MKYSNVIAIPPYYAGTSFEDITNALFIASKKSKHKIDFMGCTKPLYNSISSDYILDDSRYIDGQIKLIHELVKVGGSIQRVLFLDFFNPGLDIFKYSIYQMNHKLRIGSLLHGGSFVPGDLYSSDLFKSFEKSWFSLNDVIYVTSKYLKNVCPARYDKKVKVFHWGLDNFKLKKAGVRNWDVVFPHRLQLDKGVLDFIKIVKRLPQVNFLVTTPLTLRQVAKSQFYTRLNSFNNVEFKYIVNNTNIADVLLRSKMVLSCSIQETFGYSVMKSVVCGCYPIVPNRACYPEFFKKRYSSIKEACNTILKVKTQGRPNVEEALQTNLALSFLPLLDDFFK